MQLSTRDLSKICLVFCKKVRKKICQATLIIVHVTAARVGLRTFLDANSVWTELPSSNLLSRFYLRNMFSVLSIAEH